MAQPIEQQRSNGLDTLRAIAIMLVFMYHYMVFVSGEATFGWLSTVGWVGVDLFFVLSGYLIGNQLFAGLAQQRQLSLSAFYWRRALRTWPAFWVVLAAYFLMPSVMGGKQPPPLWTFLTFTQNYQLQPGTAFSHAWSLCIEEQFYVVLPLIVLAAMRIGTSRHHAWLLIIGGIALGITARAVLWSTYGRVDAGHIAGYHPNIYYATLCRFDELLPGVAVALIRNLYPALWRWLMAHSKAIFWLGLVAVALILYGVNSHYYVEDYGYPFFMTVFGYSCVAIAFSLLVVAALGKGTWLYSVRIPGAYHLAIWSYSIYLSHKAVAHILNEYAKQHDWSPSLKLLAITLASLTMGALLYRLVELPFMKLRDSRVPDIFHPVRAKLNTSTSS